MLGKSSQCLTISIVSFSNQRNDLTINENRPCLPVSHSHWSWPISRWWGNMQIHAVEERCTTIWITFRLRIRSFANIISSEWVYVPHRTVWMWYEQMGESWDVYSFQISQYNIKGVKMERNRWIKGRMESSWRIGACPTSDSLLAARRWRVAQLRAQSFLACLLPHSNGVAEIKQNMNRDLDLTVAHMDQSELLSSGF